MLSLVIVGAAGDLGTAVAQAARARGWQTVCLTREHLDLARPETVADGLRPHRFDALVNCAAYHRVDECQRELMRAYNVNALAVEQIAIACASECVPFVTVSTDYVFDGRKGEPYVGAAAPLPAPAPAQAWRAAGCPDPLRRTFCPPIRSGGPPGGSTPPARRPAAY